jgi:hypothetical protein
MKIATRIKRLRRTAPKAPTDHRRLTEPDAPDLAASVEFERDRIWVVPKEYGDVRRHGANGP